MPWQIILPDEQIDRPVLERPGERLDRGHVGDIERMHLNLPGGGARAQLIERP